MRLGDTGGEGVVLVCVDSINNDFNPSCSLHSASLPVEVSLLPWPPRSRPNSSAASSSIALRISTSFSAPKVDPGCFGCGRRQRNDLLRRYRSELHDAEDDKAHEHLKDPD